MTAPSAESFSGIGNRGLELRTTLGVTAVMPDFDSELGHSYTSDPPPLVFQSARVNRISYGAGRAGCLNSRGNLAQQVLSVAVIPASLVPWLLMLVARLATVKAAAPLVEAAVTALVRAVMVETRAVTI
jgi:hypothetical protein